MLDGKVEDAFHFRHIGSKVQRTYAQKRKLESELHTGILEGPYRNDNVGPWSRCTQKVRGAFSEKAFEDTETQN